MFSKFAIAAIVATLAFGGAGYAQNPQNPRQQHRQERIQKFIDNHPGLKAKIEEWKALTPEQRKAKIEQKRAEFKALTPEQKKERIAKFRAEHPGAAKVHRFLKNHPIFRKHLIHRIMNKRAGVETPVTR